METITRHKTTYLNIVGVIALSVVINIINTYIGFTIWPISNPIVEPNMVQIPAEKVITVSTRGEYSEYCLNDGSFDKQFDYLAERGDVSVERYYAGIFRTNEWKVSFDNSSYRYDAPVKVEFKIHDTQMCKRFLFMSYL